MRKNFFIGFISEDRIPCIVFLDGSRAPIRTNAIVGLARELLTISFEDQWLKKITFTKPPSLSDNFTEFNSKEKNSFKRDLNDMFLVRNGQGTPAPARKANGN